MTDAESEKIRAIVTEPQAVQTAKYLPAYMTKTDGRHQITGAKRKAEMIVSTQKSRPMKYKKPGSGSDYKHKNTRPYKGYPEGGA